MKQKLVKLMALTLCLGLGLSMVACSSGSSDSDAGSTAEAEEAAEETTEEADEEEELQDYYLELTDGTQIELTALESGAVTITGYYTCQNDGSQWVFDGSNLAMAYEDEDGEIAVYLCTMDFYSTPADDDSLYLCVILTNTLEETQTCWYVLQAVDEDGEFAGMVLQDPGDEETQIGLIWNGSDEE